MPNTTDTEWGDPVDVTCPHCGGVNKLHEQRPDDLATPQGVKWECNHCGQASVLGGQPTVGPATYVLECGNCHATFDPNTIDTATDGSWSCPACDTANRDVTAGETATGTTSEVTS